MQDVILWHINIFFRTVDFSITNTYLVSHRSTLPSLEKSVLIFCFPKICGRTTWFWCPQPCDSHDSKEDQTSPEAMTKIYIQKNIAQELKRNICTQWEASLLFLISPLWASVPRRRLMRDDTCCVLDAVHDWKWHPCFHIKANEHVMCGKRSSLQAWGQMLHVD